MAAIQYYACVVHDQDRAFELLLAVAELDELDQYVGLEVGLLPLLESIKVIMLDEIASGTYINKELELD